MVCELKAIWKSKMYRGKCYENDKKYMAGSRDAGVCEGRAGDTIFTELRGEVSLVGDI